MANLTDLIVNGAARIVGALHINSINPNPKSTDTGTIKIGTNSKIDGYRGILILQPNDAQTLAPNEGGEIRLAPNPNAVDKPGFVVDQYNNKIRVFGLGSPDGTSYIGSGEVLTIDPYYATICDSTTNYTIFQRTAELADYNSKKGANCSYVSRSHLFKKIIDVDATSGQASLPLNSVENCFYVAPTKDIQVAFGLISLVNTFQFIFELIVDMSNTGYTITWPSGVRWEKKDGVSGAPDTKNQQGIYICKFRNIKASNEWLGSWELW